MYFVFVLLGRSGLGKDSEEERKKCKRLQVYAMKAKRRKVDEENLKGHFKSRMKDKLNERQTHADLSKSQKACEQLDSQKVLKPKICYRSLFIYFYFGCTG